MQLEHLIFVGGVLHFGILIASALVPQVLDWKSTLNQLSPLFRQLVWVHGIFIVLVIIGFGVLSLCFANEIAAGTPLARGISALIAIFWGARLVVQFFVFDASAYLTNRFLKVGYHSLTVAFVYLTITYAWVACLS